MQKLVTNLFLHLVCVFLKESYFSGPPEAPTNCSVVNQTTDSLEVACLPGFDGGLRQKFKMEVADLQTGDLLANSSKDTPHFQVKKSQRYSMSNLLYRYCIK